MLRSVLSEFPIREIGIVLPTWARSLASGGGDIMESIGQTLREACSGIQKLWQVDGFVAALQDKPYIDDASIKNVRMGDGSAVVTLNLPRSLYFDLIEEASGIRVEDEGALIPILRELSRTKHAYERVADAIDRVNAVGYGIVMPSISEMTLEEPEIVRQGGKFGVRLRASAPSIHMMRADIRTEISPIVGSERQSEELLNYLLDEFEGEADRIWQSNIFGKSLHELVNEGLNAKLNHMPEAARGRLQHTLERIINEGSNGLICIIL